MTHPVGTRHVCDGLLSAKGTVQCCLFFIQLDDLLVTEWKFRIMISKSDEFFCSLLGYTSEGLSYRLGGLQGSPDI